MNYTIQDFFLEESLSLNKIFPKIKFKKQTTARKQYFCDNPECNKEIHKGELVWWYKPRPLYDPIHQVKEYFKWRTRCMDCEPDSYENLKDYRI